MCISNVRLVNIVSLTSNFTSLIRKQTEGKKERSHSHNPMRSDQNTPRDRPGELRNKAHGGDEGSQVYREYK